MRDIKTKIANSSIKLRKTGVAHEFIHSFKTKPLSGTKKAVNFASDHDKKLAKEDAIEAHINQLKKADQKVQGAKAVSMKVGKAATVPLKLANRIDNRRKFNDATKPVSLKKAIRSKPTKSMGRGLRNAPGRFKNSVIKTAETRVDSAELPQRAGMVAEAFMIKNLVTALNIMVAKTVLIAKTVAVKVGVFIAKKAAALISSITGIATTTLAIVGAAIVAIIAVVVFAFNMRAEDEAKNIRMMSPGGKAWQAVMDDYRDYVFSFIDGKELGHDDYELFGLSDTKLPLDSNFASVAVGLYKYSGGYLDLRVIGEAMTKPEGSEAANVFKGLYRFFNPITTSIKESDGKKILQITCTTAFEGDINNDKISAAMKQLLPGVLDSPITSPIIAAANKLTGWINGYGDISDQGVEEYRAALERQMTPLLAFGDAVYPFANKIAIDDRYGNRILNGEPNFHNGVDFPAGHGTPILSITSGYAMRLQNSSLGYYVGVTTTINDTNYLLVYAHMSEFADVGGEIPAGTLLGYVGNTGYSFGAHLHLGVWVGNSSVDPLTIFPWLDE